VTRVSLPTLFHLATTLQRSVNSITKLQIRSCSSPKSAVSIDALHASTPCAAPAATKAWAWALTAGSFPLQENIHRPEFSEVLLTGHDDGSVTFWDVACEVPRRLCVAGTGQRKIVSVVAVDANAGLLAVGYYGGEVRSCQSLFYIATLPSCSFGGFADKPGRQARCTYYSKCFEHGVDALWGGDSAQSRRCLFCNGATAAAMCNAFLCQHARMQPHAMSMLHLRRSQRSRVGSPCYASLASRPPHQAPGLQCQRWTGTFVGGGGVIAVARHCWRLHMRMGASACWICFRRVKGRRFCGVTRSMHTQPVRSSLCLP
jgi:hypothetical protein